MGGARRRVRAEGMVERASAIRWAVLGSLWAGGLWFATGLVAFVLEGGGYGEIPSTNWYLVEAGHAVGELGILVALLGLHHLLGLSGPRSGRWTRVGSWAAGVGTVAVFLATVLIMVDVAAAGELGDDVGLGGILFGVGLLGWLVGFPVLGVATLRSELPAGLGWLLISFVPFVLAVVVLEAAGVGGIVIGGVWLGVAATLRSHRSALQPAAH